MEKKLFFCCFCLFFLKRIIGIKQYVSIKFSFRILENRLLTVLPYREKAPQVIYT